MKYFGSKGIDQRNGVWDDLVSVKDDKDFLKNSFRLVKVKVD